MGNSRPPKTPVQTQIDQWARLEDICANEKAAADAQVKEAKQICLACASRAEEHRLQIEKDDALSRRQIAHTESARNHARMDEDAKYYRASNTAAQATEKLRAESDAELKLAQSALLWTVSACIGATTAVALLAWIF